MKGKIVIPAYEPDEKMIALICELIRLGCDVLVVDDGSGDNYTPIFEEALHLGAEVIAHESNQGKGRAIKTALEHLLCMDSTADCAVIADADGQHSVPDILNVLDTQSKNSDAIVLGVRPFDDMPLRSRLGNTITRTLFRLATGLHVSDTQTGLRSIPRTLWERISRVPGERYEFEMNMLFFLKCEKVMFVEAPIASIYIDGNRSSHYRPLRDSLRILGQFFRFSVSALICAGVDVGLYALALALMFLPFFAYAGARIFSGILNFSLNQRIVFSARFSVPAVFKYVILVLANIFVGSLLVQYFTGFGVYGIAAKLLVDCGLFFLNYLIQKRFVFAAENRTTQYPKSFSPNR